MAKAKKEAGNSGNSSEQVTAKTPESGREISVTYNFGKDLSEMTDLFGEDVVHSNAKAQMTINLQALLRRHMVDNFNKKTGEKTSDAKSDDEIHEIVAKWKPGISTRVKKSPKEKLADLLGKMSDEERRALLQDAARELSA